MDWSGGWIPRLFPLLPLLFHFFWVIIQLGGRQNAPRTRVLDVSWTGRESQAAFLRGNQELRVCKSRVLLHSFCLEFALNSVALRPLEPIARFTDNHLFRFRVSREKQSLGQLVIQTPTFSSFCWALMNVVRQPVLAPRLFVVLTNCLSVPL